METVKNKYNSLDELFSRSRKIRRGEHFKELLDFVNRFRNYSPYNNMLVYLQNPNVVYYATAKDWYNSFQRTIKEDSKPMIILAPMTPVLLVYNLDDTIGDKLPDLINEPFKTKGEIAENVFDQTLENCNILNIKIKGVELSSLCAGSVTIYNKDENSDPVIRINKEFSITQAYAVIVHELAHLFLGHLGWRLKKWKNREFLSPNSKELEAEATSYIVCSRAGIETKASEYISQYMKDEQDFEAISLDLIMKTAGKIENMGKRLVQIKKESPLQ